jgi:hypothetical protein
MFMNDKFQDVQGKFIVTHLKALPLYISEQAGFRVKTQVKERSPQKMIVVRT